MPFANKPTCHPEEPEGAVDYCHGHRDGVVQLLGAEVTLHWKYSLVVFIRRYLLKTAENGAVS